MVVEIPITNTTDKRMVVLQYVDGKHTATHNFGPGHTELGKVGQGHHFEVKEF